MLDLTLSGSNFIGGASSCAGEEQIRAYARQDGAELEPAFYMATAEEVAAAAAAAEKAFEPYAALPPKVRAAFLDEIATRIEACGDALIERAVAESGLPTARIAGERGRTCGQLRMFADLVREGAWVDARIERADPLRTPLPKPDLRRMLVPLGPVAVFGASNFPLAFSVAGGDTASALAAGCPVVVKAHPAHPGTSEIVARAILDAARLTRMPEGIFSMLHGGVAVGEALVQRPEIYAVGFTGSLAAGRALFNLAAARPRPIPVFAEMGSVNPIFILPAALAARGEQIARGYAGSLTLGVGQFCTNPGVVVGLSGEPFDRFLRQTAEALQTVDVGVMLTDKIAERYLSGIESLGIHDQVETIFAGLALGRRTAPALYSTSGRSFLAHPELAEEVFGPAGIAVGCDSSDQMREVARALEGQLTATIQMDEPDRAAATALLPLLVKGAGRVIFNSYPTGVEVNSAMQHGGPYPATTDSRSTSVGTAAILRFARPVAFQNAPQDLLPEELLD